MCVPRGRIGWSQTLECVGVGLKSHVWSQVRGADESAPCGESWLGVIFGSWCTGRRTAGSTRWAGGLEVILPGEGPGGGSSAGE